MKVNFNTNLKNIDGTTDFLEPGATGADGEPTTNTVSMKACVVLALLTPYQQDGELDGPTKYKRFQVAQRIENAEGEVAISSEEGTMILELCARKYAPLFYGQIHQLIDN